MRAKRAKFQKIPWDFYIYSDFLKVCYAEKNFIEGSKVRFLIKGIAKKLVKTTEERHVFIENALRKSHNQNRRPRVTTTKRKY